MCPLGHRTVPQALSQGTGAESPAFSWSLLPERSVRGVPRRTHHTIRKQCITQHLVHGLQERNECLINDEDWPASMNL